MREYSAEAIEAKYEQKYEAALDEVRRMAPEHCRNCDNLVVGVEDNRFFTDRGWGGEKEFYPKCAVLNEEVFIRDKTCEAKRHERIA